MVWTFDTEIFLWKADASWHFLLLPTDVAQEIDDVPLPRRGFRSLRVDVTVGDTTWRTSVFPSKSDASYLLPVKKSVREAEGLSAGDTCTVQLTLVDVDC